MWNNTLYAVQFCIYRLTGVSPFITGDIERTIKRNMQGELEYPKDLWENISKEGLDLTIKMTERDQYKRPSARDCLSHPWFYINHSKTKLKGVIHNLKCPGIDYLTSIEPEKELERRISFNTSSPMVLKQSDTVSKTSLTDLNIDSPLISGNDRTFTQRTKFPFVQFPSFNRFEAPKSDRNMNPFFSSSFGFEEDKEPQLINKDSDQDEIPNEKILR